MQNIKTMPYIQFYVNDGHAFYGRKTETAGSISSLIKDLSIRKGHKTIILQKVLEKDLMHWYFSEDVTFREHLIPKNTLVTFGRH